MPPVRGRTTLNLTQDYLEVARAAQAILGPTEESLAGRHGHPGLHNAVFTVMSLNLLYSYLALEAFLTKELAALGEATLPGSLPERVARLCELRGVPRLGADDPALVEGLQTLEADVRALLPAPADTAAALEPLVALMERAHPPAYASVVEGVLRHLHGGKDADAPPWLQRNVLLDLKAMLAD